MEENNLKNPIRIELPAYKMNMILGMALFFMLFSLFLWDINEIDSGIVISQNFITGNPAYLKFFQLSSKFGISFISAIYAILIVASFKIDALRADYPLFMFVIFAFASIAGDLLKEVIDRGRPVIDLSGQIISTKISETPSYPSGHATKSMALVLPYIIMSSNWSLISRIAKILIFLTALLVCYSRIAQQVHYPSDVIAGIGMALFFIPLAVRFSNNVYQKRKMDATKLRHKINRFAFIFAAIALGFPLL